MALDPVTGAEDLAKTIVQTFFPNKTQEEQAELGAVLAMVQGQMAINLAEAQNPNFVDQWRGGLGWVCVAGYAWNFVLMPLINAGAAISGHPIVLNPLDIGQLSTLTLGMLGLGTMHMYQSIKGAS